MRPGPSLHVLKYFTARSDLAKTDDRPDRVASHAVFLCMRLQVIRTLHCRRLSQSSIGLLICFSLAHRDGAGRCSSMAHLNTSTSLVRRSADDVALMPPPPVKRIKRPPKVLDEDDYTHALSDIIARDYFPGLRESQAQQEYLSALNSNDRGWIAEAGQKLREVMTPRRERKRRSERDCSFDRRSRTGTSVPNAADTPRGYDGSQTPTADEESQAGENESTEGGPSIDTSALSLSAFSAKYTSEDNESFNALLDKQKPETSG